jgi:hypothetical protein
MATTPVKKPAPKTKAPVVSAKKIVAAASKVTGEAASKLVAAKPGTPAKPAANAKSIANKASKTVEKKNGAAGKPVVAKPAAVAAAAKEKARKTKLVRDSFTMPEPEYAVLGKVKKACISAGVEVKKSQLLRIGLALLDKTDVATLKSLIAGLAPLKAGRPKKEK